MAPVRPPIDDALMRDIVVWDVRTWARAVEFWQTTLEHEAPPLDCLELGAGPGGPSLWLALQGHRVVCSNQEFAEEYAAPLHERYDYPGTIEYATVDALDIPWESRFDVVVFKSVLGGVGGDEEQARAIAQILKALKPGGRLLFAENVRGTVLHRAARAAMNRRRKSVWHFAPLRRMRELLSGFSSIEIHTTGVAAMFGTKESRRDALAGADRVLDRLIPGSWQYMAYGVATK